MINHAVVIGGGPAGLSASIGLRRAGFVVDLFEQRPRWQGRVCGAFLNPEAVRHLDWLGVLETIHSKAVHVHETLITAGNSSGVTRIHKPLIALGVARHTLEESLLERAQNEGVRVIIGKRFTESENVGGLVVFASGRNHHSINSGLNYYGWNATFENVDQEPGQMMMHFYPGGYVGVLTFVNGQTNICGLVRREKNESMSWQDVFEKAQDKQPRFAKQVVRACRVSEWRAVGPLPFSKGLAKEFLSRLCVGDAAAVGDPFMGEGNGRALSAGPMIYDAFKLAQRAGMSSDQACRLYEEYWKNSYSGRFRLGFWLRRWLSSPAFFSIFSKSLNLGVATYLGRKINEYGYSGKDLSHSKFGEMLSV